MIYSSAANVVALFIAVDIPRWSTRLYRPSVFTLKLDFCFFTTYIVHAFALLIAVDIQLRQILFCFADQV